MSENLPEIVNPPNFPTITGWASYEEVLDGAPVFLCRNNVATGVWRVVEGTGVSRDAQRAIVLGSEYTWEKTAYCQNVSLLWRTNFDTESAVSFSGSVLCCGQPSHATAKAVLFQNFEAPMTEVMITQDHDPELRGDSRLTFKGGFLLPEEIRRSDIIMNSRPGAEVFKSLGSRAQGFSQGDEEVGKRSISGP